MIQTLVSVPPKLDAWLHRTTGRAPGLFGAPVDFVGSDPAGRKLGSGGGTVSLLHRAWISAGRPADFEEWLAASRRLVLHAGGESRRLPAYASVGKALIPVPNHGGPGPSRHNQVLSDMQLASYQQVLREAGPACTLMVASGDVWLELDSLSIPSVEADMCGIGMRVAPEVAQHFGVFFVRRSRSAATQSGRPREQRIAFFLQKPKPAEIYRHAAEYDYYVDTGLWLFTRPAVEFLLRRCGWVSRRQRFLPQDIPSYLDLYSEIGTALGDEIRPPKKLRDLGWNRLCASVIPLEQARFFHVGSSRQLLDTFEQLAASRLDRPKLFSSASLVDDVVVRSSLPSWIDGAVASQAWNLGGHNVVTGLLPAGTSLQLDAEQCVEVAPIEGGGFVVRPYALDDSLRGPANAGGQICGQPAATWLTRRGFGVSTEDVFRLPIYPVIAEGEPIQPIISWFFAPHPDTALTARLLAAARLSAADIPNRMDFDRTFRHRATGHTAVLTAQFESCLETGDARVFSQDFAAIASHANQHPPLKRWLRANGERLLARVARPEHQSRLLMLLGEIARGADRNQFAQRAHTRLQRGVITSDPSQRADPILSLKEDQIVWGRSPVRLDLAGGWTDTPPYCLEHGGSVLNVAVLLNGQPPIQVFVRPLTEPVLSLKSIDLGSSELIRTYAELETFRDPRSGFSLPKAALAMSGFHPDFSAGRRSTSLRSRLKRFGGGLEISLLSAVPKGSGLGTSSILAATILGALNRACGLGWDEVSLYNRVLAVEQLLTTGGGWQDQAGALFRGIKLVQTSPGPSQSPSVRYLPQHLFSAAATNRSLLLYYTGFTRLAKGILKEIVHDMFLGRFETLQTLSLIRANSHALFNAVQQNDAETLARCIGRSWDLNKRLDPGTSTPAIEKILETCGPDLKSAKLLGAGGGGYMLMCADSAEAGDRIRARLEASPPNKRARFIDFEIAESGLEVTVS